MNILITGGAGYIGSHVNKWLNRNGYNTIVFDNLDRGHEESVKWGEFVYGDLNDVKKVDQIFKEHEIHAVMHFAAYAYVGESVTSPELYYRNNVVNSINLLDCMIANNVNTMVFSSSCATFGNSMRDLIDEEHPQRPINPYGSSKLMIEKILADYGAAHGLCYSILRYFNAAGADPELEIGEWHVPETHLIPLVLDAASGNARNIKIFGSDYPTKDGTCVRDYIHVFDLARAHQKAMEWNLAHGKSDSFNLGNAVGYSILDIVKAVENVTGKKIEIEWLERRAGDPPVLVASNDKASKILGFIPEYKKIEDIISTAWEWHKRMNGSK